jgi:hypothetical protein
VFAFIDLSDQNRLANEPSRTSGTLNRCSTLISRIEEFLLYADAPENLARYLSMGCSGKRDNARMEFRCQGVQASDAARLAVGPRLRELRPTPLRRRPQACLDLVQFSFPSRLVQALTAPPLIPLTRAHAARILARVKQRLETGEHGATYLFDLAQ